MPDLTIAQAAEELGVSRQRVQQFIRQGRLHATKIGVQYLINPADLAAVRRRQTGRPRTMPAPQPGT